MKLRLEEIFALIDKVKDREVDTFEYKDGDMELRIKGQGKDLPTENPKEPASEVPTAHPIPTAQPVQGSEPEGPKSTLLEEKFLYVEAPLVGTFYHAPAEGAAPFVSVGDTVKKGQVIGIIEAMKLMNEIQSEENGIVEEVIVPNETLVEFGQKLIRLRPL